MNFAHWRAPHLSAPPLACQPAKRVTLTAESGGIVLFRYLALLLLAILLAHLPAAAAPQGSQVIFSWPRYLKQIASFLRLLAHGSLGQAAHGSVAIIPYTLHLWFASLLLILLALLLALLIGLLLGIQRAAARQPWRRQLSLLLNILMLALPNFLAILICQVIIVFITLHVGKLFPVIGEVSPRGLVLPVLALSLFPAGQIARSTTVAFSEALSADFVRTAHSKGVNPRRVLYKHVLKNALYQVFNDFPASAALLLSGSVIVEYISAYPGLGKVFAVDQQFGYDPRLTVSVVWAYVTTYFVMALLSRWLCWFLDPRARVRNEGQPLWS